MNETETVEIVETAKNSSISVLISTYNGRAELEKVLKAFLQLRKQPFEYLICDDGSSDGTDVLVREYSEKFSVPLRHVYQEDNGWDVQGIRNEAALLAKGDYLVFIDGDCIPSRRFLEEHQRLIAKGGFVFGNRCHVDESYPEQFNNSFSTVLRYALSKKIRKRFVLFGPALKVKNIDINGFRWDYHYYSNLCIACNFGIWKEDFMMVGGFDEGYRRWWAEDTDIAIRLLNAGLKGVKVYKECLVFHLDHPSRVQSDSDHDVLIQERLRDGVIVANSRISSLQESE